MHHYHNTEGDVVFGHEHGAVSCISILPCQSMCRRLRFTMLSLKPQWKEQQERDQGDADGGCRDDEGDEDEDEDEDGIR